MSTAIATPDPPVSTPVAIPEAAADRMGHLVLTPRYDAPWRGIWASSEYYWWAYRHYLHNGQIVVQLGTKKCPARTGEIKVAIRKDFTARTTGTHALVFQMDAGPITSIQGAMPDAYAHLAGGRVHDFNLASNRTSYPSFREFLVRDRRYSVWVAGKVKIYPTNLRPYGEMIFTCPKIRVIPLPFRSGEPDPLDDRLSELVPGNDSLDATVAALAEEYPGDLVEIGEGSADLEERIFSSFDVSTEN